ITVLTFLFFKHHAILNSAVLICSLAARSDNFLTFFNLSSPIHLSLSQSKPANAKRLPFGIPSLYLPLSKPDAKGLQIVVPMPTVLNISRYSLSTFSLSNKLYWGCSVIGPISLY